MKGIFTDIYEVQTGKVVVLSNIIKHKNLERYLGTIWLRWYEFYILENHAICSYVDRTDEY